MSKTNTRPTLPPSEALRTLFDEAVFKLSEQRPDGPNLTNGFYAQVGDAVFSAGCAALTDHCNDGPSIVRTIAAPAGGGKTTFSYALIYALTQHAEVDLESPYGCVLVVDQVTKADKAFSELNALLPGQVAVWTKEHDRGSTKRERLSKPAAEFTQDDSGTTR